MSTKRRSSRKKKSGSSVPRRAEILRFLERHGTPLTEAALYRAFSLRSTGDRETLGGRLERMLASGQIFRDRRDRWALPARMDMLRGRVSGHPDGYGFITPDQGGGDLFVPESEMRKVLHGDRVLARVRGVDRRGRREAHIVEVIEHANRTVVGRYQSERKAGFVVPDDTRISQDIYVAPNETGGARDGQIVVVEITRHPSERAQPGGRVIEILGEHMAPGMEIEIAIRKHGLPYQWNDDVVAEVQSVPATVESRDRAGRRDLRRFPLVTIDGEDARDFDDAVYCEPRSNGWRLWVAIADVSHYVVVNSAIDQEGYARGNSVYFPERAIPMLPEVLSNGICSLIPQEDRLCFVCEMDITHSGEITRYKFYEAVMHSHARLTYTQVAELIETGGGAIADLNPPLVSHLEELNRLHLALRRHRSARGAIDLELPETRIVFNEQRKIERIEPRLRNDAHRLIEECMLAANICAADIIVRNEALGMFRIHDAPDPDKVEELRQFLRASNITLGGGASPEPTDYAAVVGASENRPDARVIHMALLLSMNRAMYSTENSGHFALSIDRYTHFTSPIRRYPDLYVHRVIKQVLSGGGFSADEVDLIKFSAAAEHCSMTERRADDATRDAVQWLKAEYMLEHIGETYSGVVTGVTDFGVFVELSSVYVEGLIHVTSLGNDYFHFDPVRRRLVGERTGRVFGPGTAVQVRVARVDLDRARIDFDLVGTVRRKRRARR